MHISVLLTHSNFCFSSVKYNLFLINFIFLNYRTFILFTFKGKSSEPIKCIVNTKIIGKLEGRKFCNGKFQRKDSTLGNDFWNAILNHFKCLWTSVSQVTLKRRRKLVDGTNDASKVIANFYIHFLITTLSFYKSTLLLIIWLLVFEISEVGFLYCIKCYLIVIITNRR